MCGQFHYGKVSRAYGLFQLVVSHAHELVYREMFTFVRWIDIAGHFREKRVKTSSEYSTSDFRPLRLVRAASRCGASGSHVIRLGRFMCVLRCFINNRNFIINQYFICTLLAQTKYTRLVR